MEGHKHSHGVIEHTQAVRRVLVSTLALNLIVAIAKVLWGYLTNSVGMISDGFHSLFDGISNVIGLVGIWVAAHPPDDRHPYGHKKYETFFTISIAFAIFVTCFQILKRAWGALFEAPKVEAGQVSFIVMAFTISVNMFVMLYEGRKGRELKSEFLIADALHTKSDILASLAVVGGLFFTRMGYPLADTIAGLVIAFFIGRIGYEIMKSASDVMTDTICINTDAIEAVVNTIEGVRGCHQIRTRGTLSHIYLDLHVLVDPNISVDFSHDIADAVEKRLKAEFAGLVDVVVHIEPDRRKTDRACVCPTQHEGHKEH